MGPLASRCLVPVLLGVSLLGAVACDRASPPSAPATAEPDARAERATPDRPSVLLVVLDTLRADAVSAYGEVEGTTPRIDALAREGLLYRNAFAPAPWTLPSHASLFTGRSVADHGVGMPQRMHLDEGFVTLAERFAEAGYATAAFTENLGVSDVFGMLQGFEVRRFPAVYKVGTGGTARTANRPIEATGELAAWLAEREEKQRPFFAFVNLMDAHVPYQVPESNPFAPEGTSEREQRSLHPRPDTLLCDALPVPRELALFRALYLAQVARADERVSRMLRMARSAAGGDLITIVTSDHGELFGEHGLMGHFYSLHGALLHVPLVVHGLPGVEPAVVDAPVSLLDLAPSILAWSGLPALDGMDGRPLPEAPAAAEADGRALPAFFSDRAVYTPEAWQGLMAPNNEERRRCPPTQPVYGAMASLRRFPWKLVWYEDYPPELYDLRWDGEQRLDVSAHHPEEVAALSRELEPLVEASGLLAEPGAPAADPEALRALEALGYLE